MAADPIGPDFGRHLTAGILVIAAPGLRRGRLVFGLGFVAGLGFAHL